MIKTLFPSEALILFAHASHIGFGWANPRSVEILTAEESV